MASSDGCDGPAVECRRLYLYAVVGLRERSVYSHALNEWAGELVSCSVGLMTFLSVCILVFADVV